MKLRSMFLDGQGKLSSKRVSGLVGFTTFLVMAVLSGFAHYDIDSGLVLGGLGICAGLLGVSSLTKEA